MRASRHILVFACLGVASLTTESRLWAEVANAPPGADARTPKGERGLAAEGTAREPGSPPPPSAMPSGFDFGSYGRLGVGLDGRGHEGYATNVVSHGSRLEEPPYLELNFYYTRPIGGDPHRRWRIVLAPAFAGGDLFHYSGSFSSHLALRNAYAETENLGLDGLSL